MGILPFRTALMFSVPRRYLQQARDIYGRPISRAKTDGHGERSRLQFLFKLVGTENACNCVGC